MILDIENADFSEKERKFLKYYYLNKDRYISTKEVSKHLGFKGPSGVNASMVRIVKKILNSSNKSPQKRTDGSSTYWRELFEGIYTENNQFYWKLRETISSQLEHLKWINSPINKSKSYYIIGSKYRDDNNPKVYKDIFPKMIAKGVIAFGYGWDENLNALKGLSDKEKKEIIKKYDLESSQISHQIRKFTSIKPGDIIAIKLAGNYSKLVIRGYAIVKENQDVLIKKDDELGNVIEVDYLHTNLDLKLPFHYAQTIYRIEDYERIESIFLNYLDRDQVNFEQNSVTCLCEKGQDGINKKNINPIRISYEVDKIMSRRHNEIQQRIYDYLVNKYGEESVFMEKNYVDIQLELLNTTVLYEVKPFESVTKCIKDALGQLLHYCSANSNELTLLRIVGPNEPNEIDELYMNFLKENINLDISYISEKRLYDLDYL